MRPLIVVLLALYALSANAQLYRWKDPSGRVHYTDTPPPPGATGVEQKSSSVSSSSSAEPFVVQQARSNFPVKLYSAPGCAPCDSARALLNSRGVPFSEVSVGEEAAQVEELKKTTGTKGVPALVVGKAVQSGFEEGIYHRMLDEAGYPKTGMLPPRHQAEPAPVKTKAEEEASKPEPPLGPYAPGSRSR